MKQKVAVALLVAGIFGAILYAPIIGFAHAQEPEPERTASQYFNESVIVAGYTLEQIDAVPEAELAAVRAGIVRDRATASRAKRTLIDLIEALDERIGGGESKVRRRIRDRIPKAVIEEVIE